MAVDSNWKMGGLKTCNLIWFDVNVICYFVHKKVECKCLYFPPKNFGSPLNTPLLHVVW